MQNESGILYYLRALLARHHRLIAATLLVVFLLGGLVAAYRWQNPPGPLPPAPIEVVTGPVSCHHDPAHVPTPPPNAANYLHTCGSQIYDAHGRLVKISGVSWFGLETANMAPDGLWARNWQTILAQLSALGYNTLRLPFSDDIFQPNARPSGINYLLNPDLKGLTSLQIMDKVIAGARQYGLRVLLDRHRPSSAGQSDLWYTKTRSEAQWIAEWKMLAQRYQGNDTVIGADLNNEPRGPATWGTNDPATDWRLAAQKAGNAILSVNPYWLIFVEGIEREGNDYYWWGGNLEGVARAPVILNLPDRVVYSPHDYGPSVYPQGWFKAANFPINLPSVWNQHWGYIAERGIAPVVLGEFGGRSVGSDKDGQWQRSLIDYLAQHDIGFISWALNPDSGDTGGLLDDNWMTVVSAKQSLYSSQLGPKIKPAQSQVGQVLQPLRMTYHSV
ncbi:MAG TPA: glycoside hydrolase family 5 protein, partial [Chloroflexota bacterium]|nr:glycoside hydrolase family 5 protein [Chloroflexota bacterium]